MIDIRDRYYVTLCYLIKHKKTVFIKKIYQRYWLINYNSLGALSRKKPAVSCVVRAWPLSGIFTGKLQFTVVVLYQFTVHRLFNWVNSLRILLVNQIKCRPHLNTCYILSFKFTCKYWTVVLQRLVAIDTWINVQESFFKHGNLSYFYRWKEGS